MIISAEAGNLAIFKYLIAHSSCNTRHADHHGRNALHCAAQKKHFEVVKHYVESYYGGDMIMLEDKTGVTPFQLSAEADSLAIFKLFTAHPSCNPSHTDSRGRNAFIMPHKTTTWRW